MGFENAASYNNSQSWRQLLEEINRWRYSKKIMLDWRDKEKNLLARSPCIICS